MKEDDVKSTIMFIVTFKKRVFKTDYVADLIKNSKVSNTKDNPFRHKKLSFLSW